MNLGQTNVGASQWYQFVVLQELPVYIRHTRLGIIRHQEEPRSKSGSKDIICIPIVMAVRLPLSPSMDMTHHQTAFAERCYRQDNIFHGFFRYFHVCHMSLR